MYQSKNALIVLNYNDSTTTSKFVEMAKKSKSIEHIVVVDNCSPDGSYEKLKGLEDERVVVIESSKNGGYSYGNNFGCRYAIENYHPQMLIVSNPDVTFENDVIDSMSKVLEENERIGVVAPIVNQGYNIWNLPGFVGLIESIFLIWFNLDKKRIKNNLMNLDCEWTRVGVVEGSFWAIKVAAYEEADGFDERTFLYCEENIFAKRLETKGYFEVALNACRYNHFHSVSIKKHYGGKVKAFKNFHASMLVYLKYYLNAGMLKRLIFELAYGIGYVERFFYDCVMAVKGLKK